MAAQSLHFLIRQFFKNQLNPQQLRELIAQLNEKDDSVLEFMEHDWASFKADEHQGISVEKGNKMLDVILKTEKTKGKKVLLTGWLPRSAAVWLLLLLTASLWIGYQFDKSREVIFISKQSKKILLPDGTRVHLHGETRLSYQKSFWENERNVKFTGEGFFEVHPNKDQPFIIQTPTAHVRVVGTSFNLKHDKEGMWVAVSEGKVLLSNQKGKTISLVKNQLGQVSSNGAMDMENTDVSNYFSWQPGKSLIFNNMTFDKVAHQLERMYGVKIQWPKTLDNKRLTASSHYDTLPNILDKISLSLDIKYKIDNKIIIFRNQ